MTFWGAVKSGYGNYVNFRDRAPRAAFWYWVLWQAIVTVAIALVEGGGQGTTGPGTLAFHYEAGPLALLWHLANLLPGLGLSVRRLHDLDKSGWWSLIAVVPLVGAIVLAAWFVNKGTTGANRFGPDPLA